MIHLIKLIYTPGGENESGSITPRNEVHKEQNTEHPERDKNHKTFIEKIKEALHDWSNKDEQDQKFDDTRV